MPVVTPVNVLLPNGSHMSSTHTRQLNIPTLPPAECVQHRFPAMKTTGLLSIGQLCDHECSATFYQHHLVIKNKRATTILVGHQNYSNVMWMVQLGEHARPHTTLPLTCNTIMLSDTTKKDLAQFHHASFGSPVPFNSSRQLMQASSHLSQDSPRNL